LSLRNEHRSLFLALPLVAGAGCLTNQSGDLATSKTGDLSNPLAERAAPDVEEVARCGAGGLRAGIQPAVVRAPYVQRISPSEGRIMWTEEPGDPAQVSVLQEDRAGAQLARVAPSAAIDGTEPGGGALAYDAALDQLQPDTIYCYQLGDGDAALTSPAGFRTAPEPGGGAKISFVAFGDSGSGSADQMAILEQLATVPFRFMIHTGDIAYESGTMDQFEQNYFAVYAPLIRSFAMFPSSGNHDEAEVYHQVFDLPWADGAHNWYSFDYGDAHFVSLDTNDVSDEQAAWLDQDLTANQREWTIVYGHHPAFSSGEHGSTASVQDKLVPLFERHGVDLVLAGHDHDYERIEAQNGVHYVVTGGGGRGTRPVGSSSFTAFSEQVLNFVYVEIEGHQLVLHAIDATGEEFDQLAIDH